MARLISVTDINPVKHLVIDKGKIISRHGSFYLAQCAVEKHLRKNKISNNYQIVSENDRCPYPQGSPNRGPGEMGNKKRMGGKDHGETGL